MTTEFKNILEDISSSQMARLKKEYEPLRKIDMSKHKGQIEKTTAMLSKLKMGTLIDLSKEDIPVISDVAKSLVKKDKRFAHHVEEVLDEAGKILVKDFRQVIKIAIHHSGDMESAIKDIEKYKKGLSDHPDVVDILKKANEEVTEADLTKTQIKMVHDKADELPKHDFIKRYGKDGDSVRFATATNIVKKKLGITEGTGFLEYDEWLKQVKGIAKGAHGINSDEHAKYSEEWRAYVKGLFGKLPPAKIKEDKTMNKSEEVIEAKQTQEGGPPADGGPGSGAHNHGKKKFSSATIKKAYGILNDPRYKGGNYSGAVKAIDKLAKGLSDHPDVKNALKRANESIDKKSTEDKLKKWGPVKQMPPIKLPLKFGKPERVGVKASYESRKYFDTKPGSIQDTVKKMYEDNDEI